MDCFPPAGNALSEQPKKKINSHVLTQAVLMSSQASSDTGYPYARYREARGGVLAFLLVLTGVLHADEMVTPSDGEANTDAILCRLFQPL